MSHAPDCPYCNNKSVLADSAEVYGGRSFGPIYICRPCDAYVGCHKGTTNPLGRLANYELRHWKKKAHAAFDPIWQRSIDAVIAKHGFAPKGIKQKVRGWAYHNLAKGMAMGPEDCHIGMFDVAQCKRVVEVCGSWTVQFEERT